MSRCRRCSPACAPPASRWRPRGPRGCSMCSCCPTPATPRCAPLNWRPGSNCATCWATEGTRVYYRWRQRRSQRKAGNVADFCRRWGRDYRYMVVLDADSVMSGDCLLSLVRLMEAHPRAGILQTAPQACGLSTLHARAQQFAGRVAGRLFAAGMQYWQLGESHYWGHNAIIRVEPFMRHCALAPLPGRGQTGTEILSHDFVEAALMRRAGYQVWLVPDLAWQLRTAAAQPAGRAAARPPLVPGQPAQRPADRRTRPAPGAPRHAGDRGHGLPVGTAVAGVRAAGRVRMAARRPARRGPQQPSRWR